MSNDELQKLQQYTWVRNPKTKVVGRIYTVDFAEEKAQVIVHTPLRRRGKRTWMGIKGLELIPEAEAAELVARR